MTAVKSGLDQPLRARGTELEETNWVVLLQFISSVCIKKALGKVIWDVLFHLKGVHEEVNVFNDVVISIFAIYYEWFW